MKINTQRSAQRHPSFRTLFLLFLTITCRPLLALPAESTEVPPISEVSQETEDVERPTVTDTMTVTATRGPREIKEVPGSVTVITSEQIESHLNTQLSDLVRHLPGVSVAQSPVREGAGGFVIRGIGGNRVLTQTDGVGGLEEFEFSRLQIPQVGLDLSTLESVEIVRGGQSALYGSDALGGVVSLMTKDPHHYLGDENFHFSTATSWDSRDDSGSLTGSLAFATDRWQFSTAWAVRNGGESSSQGTEDSATSSRTVANPQEWDSLQLLSKGVRHLSDSNLVKVVLEHYDRTADTDIRSSQGTVNFGRIFGFPPSVTFLLDRSLVEGHDTQKRLRTSLEQSLVSWGPIDQLSWRAWYQRGETSQTTEESLTTSFGGGFLGPVVETRIQRSGLLTFEQDSLGAESQIREVFSAWGGEHLLTAGISYLQDDFDQFRDSVDLDLDSALAVERSDELIFPTKYFPATLVTQIGLYAQAELSLLDGRISLVPGIRWDDYELDANQTDPTYLSGNLGTLEPIDLSNSAISPRLGIVTQLTPRLRLRGQLSEGFRAPPYSHVNGGFTHLAGSLTRLPNRDLKPETSLGWDVGLRFDGDRSFIDVTYFDAQYDDFIELVPLGLNPATGFTEFQQQNVARAEINGWEIAGQVTFGRDWRLRGGASWTDGTDQVKDQPLLSVEPPTATLGLAWTSPLHRWGTELAITAATAKEESDLPQGVDQFTPPSYELLDFTSFYHANDRLTLRLGLLNLTDETYWNWSSVIGQKATFRAIDRYSSPGRTVSASAQFSW